MVVRIVISGIACRIWPISVLPAQLYHADFISLSHFGVSMPEEVQDNGKPYFPVYDRNKFLAEEISG